MSRPFCIHTKHPLSRDGASVFVVDLDKVISIGMGASVADPDSDTDPISLDITWTGGGLHIGMTSREEAESILARMVACWTHGIPPMGNLPAFLKESSS